MDTDVIIVGAGASGMIAAIMAARAEKRVLLLEQKEKIGKKIYATGNGRCNYTNMKQDISNYRGTNPQLAYAVIKRFGALQTIEFFRKLGIEPKDKNGYLYPRPEQASAIVSVMEMELRRLNVTILCENRVTAIRKRKEKFEVSVQEKKYNSKAVILAAGGMASPKLGSDGSGYQLAVAFGHHLIPPVPALVQLCSDEKYFKTLAGIRTDGTVTIYSNHKKIAEAKGEIQLTNYGISGIPVFEVSRFASNAIRCKEKVTAKIDFLPDIKQEENLSFFNRRISGSMDKTAGQCMLGLFPEKLAKVLLMQAGIKADMPVKNVKKREWEQYISLCKNFSVPIIKTNSFEQAQVTAGGIAIDEINLATMESRYMKNLYLTGELLDVDGTCGGYNLQWAWSTGYFAGMSAGE